jgi:hypothetical protein
MENRIIGFERANNQPRIISKNGDVIYTINSLSNGLVDTSTISRTNKFYVYYNGANWVSRQSRIGQSALIPTTFSDITQPTAFGANAKFTYQSATSRYLVIQPNYWRNLTLTYDISTAGQTAINTNNENHASSLLGFIQNGNGSGITFSTSTHLYTFSSTTLNRLYYISYYFYLPYTSLTDGAECIFRIRKTNITGDILGEMRYRNTDTTTNYICCNFGIITNNINPGTICATFQLASGVFGRTVFFASIKFNIYQIC